ncbi:MAG: hypothetical protein JXO48_08810 [Deltaproteobacteria bacterium]|nr:hypothetical protein [Deltaproteobacteria bacterium]
MKRNLRVLMVVFCLAAVSMFLTTAMVTNVCAADEMVIIGVVNPSGQLVAEDGNSYFIDQNDAGKELAAMAGKKVQVMGTVQGEGDAKTLTISSFEEI